MPVMAMQQDARRKAAAEGAHHCQWQAGQQGRQQSDCAAGSAQMTQQTTSDAWLGALASRTGQTKQMSRMVSGWHLHCCQGESWPPVTLCCGDASKHLGSSGRQDYHG